MKKVSGILQILTTIILPGFLIMTAVMVLFNPWFLVLEYTRPGFPPDPYGFTSGERLIYGGISLDYMHNSEDIEFLAQPKLKDGSPLYNERELSHMEDVKGVFQGMIVAWVVILIFITITGLISWRGHASKAFWQSISSGGWGTIIVVGVILGAVAIAFEGLFTLFHKLFFTGDSWLFEYSDSLIRLFPIQLWTDAFIWMGGITLVLAVIIALGSRWLARQ
jgi:integral membrane protein (TIGR01906 family)